MGRWRSRPLFPDLFNQVAGSFVVIVFVCPREPLERPEAPDLFTPRPSVKSDAEWNKASSRPAIEWYCLRLPCESSARLC